MSEPHDCRSNDRLTACANDVDTWKCSVCGREIQEPCDFDEDYS
jgi:ribosomal protein L37AE/L43A